MNSSNPKKCVFLDRDGTIIFDKNYISKPDDAKAIPGAFEALKILRKAGFMLVLVSNQSGVGRGYFTSESVDRVNEKVLELAMSENLRFDGVYYCPHHPNDNCDCRKPAPGLLLKASKDLCINLQKSAMVGDKQSDIEAGVNAGCPLNIIIDRNLNRGKLSDNCYAVKNLAEAVDIILCMFNGAN